HPCPTPTRSARKSCNSPTIAFASRASASLLALRRPNACPAAGGASRDGVGLLTPVLLLRQEGGHQLRPIVASGEDDDQSSRPMPRPTASAARSSTRPAPTA